MTQTVITDKYIIRNAPLRLDDYLFFLGLLILLYFIIIGLFTEFVVVIFLGLFGYTAYRIINRLQDRSDKIIIDKNGIKLCDENYFISWSKIRYAYIKQKSEGIGRSARVVDYFHIDTKEREIKVRMNAFKYKQELLIQTIEHFSGRNIGELTDLLRDNAKIIIGNDRNVERISKIMTVYYKRMVNLTVISFFTLIGISIYLQVIIDCPYVFAIGLTLTFGILSLIGILDERRLRNKEFICDLDDKTFKALVKDYSQLYDLNVSKGKLIATIIFLILIVIGIYGLSYMISKEKDKPIIKKTEQSNSLPNNS